MQIKTGIFTNLAQEPWGFQEGLPSVFPRFTFKYIMESSPCQEIGVIFQGLGGKKRSFPTTPGERQEDNPKPIRILPRVTIHGKGG